MGTSRSYGGPGDKPGLLPDWAYDVPDGELPAAGDGPPDGGPPDTGTPQPADLGEPHFSWRAAKGSLGRAASGGAGEREIRHAAQRYVGAHGGPRRAAATAAGGQRVTAALGGFLSDVRARGAVTALRALGLATVVGSDTATVFAALTNQLAPAGATREDALARKALADALEGLFERVGADGDIGRLEQMNADDVRDVIEAAVAAYIYWRWVEELGAKLEENAVSAAAAVGREAEMREYIEQCVRLDVGGRDVLSIDWQRGEGRALIEKIFAEAYSTLSDLV